MWLEIILFIIGFLSYFLISIPVIIGYEIVRRLCKRIKNNEETKDLENAIMVRSYIVKAFEKITAMTLCAIFLFELDKYKKMLDIGYIILFIITVILYFIPQISTIALATFLGVSLDMLIVTVLKYLALKEYFR